MTILDHSPMLRLLTEARDALYGCQRLTPSDDRAAGQRLADILEMVEDAIVEEVRALNAADTVTP